MAGVLACSPSLHSWTTGPMSRACSLKSFLGTTAVARLCRSVFRTTSHLVVLYWQGGITIRGSGGSGLSWLSCCGEYHRMTHCCEY